MTTTHSDAALTAAVLAWRDQPARPDLRGLPAVNVPVVARVSKAIPPEAAQRILAASYAASFRLSQPAALLRKAGAESLEALRGLPLGQRDALARDAARQSGWLAGGSGAVLGLAGAAGLVVDAPALLLIALRTLMRLIYSYGERPSPALVAALFALASADTDEEKQVAWQAALAVPRAEETSTSIAPDVVREAALRDGLERAAEREFAKQAIAGSVQKLTSTLVQRLGMKKVTAVLPFVGAAVGGAVNLRFVHLLSTAARMALIARCLHAEGLPLDRLLLRQPLEPLAVKRPGKKPARRPAARAKRRPEPAP